MKHEYIKDYKNIRIRPLEYKDLELLRGWRNNTDNCNYLSKISYISSEMQQKWFEGTFETPNEYIFAIEERKELNRLVGSLALYNVTDIDGEFGKILIGDNAAHGKKVGVNSLIALLSIGFNELNINVIYLHVYEDNIAAVKVYSQVGFSLLKKRIINGISELVMQISKSDYLEREKDIF